MKNMNNPFQNTLFYPVFNQDCFAPCSTAKHSLKLFQSEIEMRLLDGPAKRHPTFQGKLEKKDLEKAQELAGFEPTSSGTGGLHSTTVQPLLFISAYPYCVLNVL